MRASEELSVTPLQTHDFSRTGPGTPAGRYLRRFWTPVAVLDDVEPGRARPIQILGERLTYFRGATGAPHLVGLTCAHRGTQLASGWVEGDRIRCFYHGWAYDGSGQCVEQPAENDSFADKVRIPSYPVREYLGLVFAYFGEGEPPPLPRLAAFEKPGYLEPKSYVRRTNFYNQLENSVDQVHINFVHKRSGFESSGSNREIPEIIGEETDYGILRRHLYSDGKERVAHILMPIAMFSKVVDTARGWTDHLAFRVPVDDTTHRSFIVDLIEKSGAELERYFEVREEQRRLQASLPSAEGVVADILRGDLHVDDVDDHRPDLVGIQDDVALTAQPALHQRPADRLGRSDVQVILLRKLWARELRALADGTPLKQWSYPAALSVTSGV